MKKKMTYKGQIIAVTTLLLWQTLLSYGQNEPVKMTFIGIKPFESENSNTHYQCHLSEPDNIAATAQVESFRTVWTRNDANENVDPPAAVWNDGATYKHWRATLDNGNDDSFGVFGCEAALDGRINTSISGIFMRSDADIVPSDEFVSVTVNVGDVGVSIGMKSTGSKNVADFRWLKDNVRNYAISGQDTWVISRPVEVDDAGFYECHIIGERSDAKQGLKLLIVRACPPHRWGPDACDGICDNCYNGGICDENSGKCICAPGFKGANCEEACDSGTYGASCLQTCHCQSGQCNMYTGVCTGSPPGCSSGWTGTNCQGNVACDKITGECPNQSCAPGYKVHMGQVNCEDINECYSDPCMNGGTCIDSINMFLCTCPLGFEGFFCENNTNECYSDPCMNGGTCIDSINMFLCSCPLLFVGIYCENDKPAEEIETILSGIADDTGGINMTDEEVKMFADAVQEATSDGEFLAEDPARIEITVSALESVVGEGVSSVEVTESVIRAVNNLIEVDGDVRDNVMDVGGRIVEALEKQLRNYQENEGNFSQIYEDIVVVSINVEPSNVGGSLNFAHVLEDSSTRNLTVGLRGGTNKIYGDARNVPLEQVITSISVPPEVLKLLVGADGKVPISFIIYNSDALFTPSKPTRRNSMNGDDDDDDDRDKYSNSSISERIVSQIISTIIATGDKDDDEDNGGAIDIPVDNPIISTFFIMENLDEREEKLDSSCVVWLYNEDTDEGFWSDESCDMLSDDSDLTVCSCKHTGSFAVLIRVGPLEPEIALYYITLIGSIISGMCLIVCIVTFLSIKSLRSKQPTQIHINLCVSLLGFYIAFLVGPLAVGKKQQCAAVSTIIQFFCLATLAWMSAEALNMYYLFLKAKKGSIRYFTAISCIVAYGSSFTCVILVAFLDRSTDYGTANYCFIHPGYALYFGFLAEVGAMFVLNLIIFVMVIWKVLCRPVMVSKAKEHAKRNEIMTRIRHGVSFWFVLGLSWIFGFLAAVDQSTLIFDYLYCIFIALQGFLMFLLLCVANPDFRKMFSIQKRSESSQSSNVCPSTVNSISESNQCEISGKKNIIKTSNC